MVDLLFFAILIALSGFFSSAETAFFSLSSARARLMGNSSALAERCVWTLRQRPEELLVTILIGNNIVNLFTASYATVVAAQFFGSAALGIATGVTTIMILVFGEILPKSFAYAQNEMIARFAAIPLCGLRLGLYPLVRGLTWLSHYLQRYTGRAAAGVTEAEVRMMARMSVEHGEMDYREHEMIENVFRFDDIRVKDIMTKRYKMIALNGTVPVEQIAYFVGQDGHSRYPVYIGDEDDIIGYVHVNTLLKVLKSNDRDRPVRDFVSPIPSVPEVRKVERVFRAMKRDTTHMFLVHKHQSPGDIVGLVTLEDVIEQIVGEIVDETDDDE